VKLNFSGAKFCSMEIFYELSKANDFLLNGEEPKARDEVIKVLDYLENNNIEYPIVLNHLIREVGLFPYIKPESSIWEDRLIYEFFKADIGLKEKVTLHREQSFILKKLLNGENLLVSAPTSFGKSFIIDAFISISKPQNVMIIVPTLALTDETRRRISKKFSHLYKIITTTDAQLGDQNIFIFPQERAINYIDKLESLDLLVIDEFYKAGKKFDKDRSYILLKSLIELGKISKQKYLLAPNIHQVENPLLNGVEFVKLNFNTVYLEKNDLYKEIGQDKIKKNEKFIQVFNSCLSSKTIIYSGSYSDIDKIGELISNNIYLSEQSKLITLFYDWIEKNYTSKWHLLDLLKRGVGVHNGNMHRALSQLQIKLFEEVDGLNSLITTSSIIEGVNTSAKNIIVWSNKNGRSRFDDFTYKNIIGRGGRMFKHFIGSIYILEKPPEEENTQLELELSEELFSDIDENLFLDELTELQIENIRKKKSNLIKLIGKEGYVYLKQQKALKSSSINRMIEIAKKIRSNPNTWSKIRFISDPSHPSWESTIYNILKIEATFGIQHKIFVDFLKVLTHYKNEIIPNIPKLLIRLKINVDTYFKLERKLSFEFSSLLNDINNIQKILLSEYSINIDNYVHQCSYAFLPKNVFLLEEYGLPRMVTKKLYPLLYPGLNPDDNETNIHELLNDLAQLKNLNLSDLTILSEFERYILEFFLDGIS
jgi:hypothetical protein